MTKCHRKTEFIKTSKNHSQAILAEVYLNQFQLSSSTSIHIAD